MLPKEDARGHAEPCGPKVQVSAIATLLERMAGSGTNPSHVLVKVEGPVRIELGQILQRLPQAGVLVLEVVCPLTFVGLDYQGLPLGLPQAGVLGLQLLYA